MTDNQTRNIISFKRQPCRLCRKVALAVFISILIIEAIILIPSYKNYERDELSRLESAGLAAIQTLEHVLPKNLPRKELLANFKTLMEHSVIKGGTVFDPDGLAIFNFGDVPATPMNENPPGFLMFVRYRTEGGNAYDVRYDAKQYNLPYSVIARLDSSHISSELSAFVLRIIGLVAVISVVVTLTTLWGLNLVVIKPIMRLRTNLLTAAADPIHSKTYRIGVDLQDEIGDVYNSFNHMLKRIENGMRKIQEHEQDLEQANQTLETKVLERTQALKDSNERLEKEILERKRFENELVQLANYDVVTELPNRNLTISRLSSSICQAKNADHLVAIMVLQLNDFQEINDAFGHQIGDMMLKEIGSVLNKRSRINTVGRIGTQQMALITESLDKKEESVVIAEHILELFSRPFSVSEQSLITTINIGIAIAPCDTEEPEELLRNADLALHRARDIHPNSYQFYEAHMNTQIETRHNMLVDLHYAIERDELMLYYQPQVDLKANKLIGLEALIRWNHPSLGIVPPNEFIPLAESSGLIVPIGEWVLRTACEQVKAWQDNGAPEFCIAVNLSSIQFRQQNIVQLVKQTLTSSGLKPELLELEITESVVMHNVDDAIQTMEELHSLGVMLAMDDFGTGYSSLSYLKRFPVQKIKIDQSFIRSMDQGQESNIADAIIYLAHKLGLKVIAEGVETEHHEQFLKDRGCDEAQGYYYGRPASTEDVQRYFN